MGSKKEKRLQAAPIRIHSGTDRLKPRIVELWRYRDLLFFLTWRDVKVRYKQTAFGALWAVLQPALTMAVFSIIFGRLARMPSDGVPYPVFALCGLLPWQLFSFALTNSAASLVANERLVTRVYFPRLIVPLASVLAGLVDFGIALVVTVALALWYGIVPRWSIAALPALALLALAAAVAVGTGLGALNVRFRDVRHALPFASQIWLFLTPIAYPASLVPGAWRPIYGLNPMVGVVEGFRWALLGRTACPIDVIGMACCVTALVLWASLRYFASVERGFADIV